jgi:translation initiation factor 2 subunit 2
MEQEILPLIDFSKVKKKKKEIPKSETEPEDLSNIMITKKKHKEENQKEKEEKELEKSENQNNEEDYTYEFLLERVYKMIKSRDSNSTENRGSIKMPVPQVNLVGKSRSAWTNFNDFVKVLNRSQEHLFQYVLGELGVEGTIGGENQFFLKSKINSKDIETILRKYIHDYVQCPNCKSVKTIIKKDQGTRLLQIYCENCKTEKTVQHLKSHVKAGKK